MKQYVFSVQQIREIDGYNGKLGLDTVTLMSNFAIRIAEEIELFLSGLYNASMSCCEFSDKVVRNKTLANKLNNHAKKSKILFICGSGNNGGDGFATARILKRRGHDVFILMPFEIKSNAANKFYNLCLIEGVKVISRDEFDTFNDKFRLSCFDLIVDALLGIGLSKSLDEKTCGLVDTINESNVPVISIDVPSGIDEYGFCKPVAVKADLTITACGQKFATVLGDSANFVGQVKIVDILASYPKELLVNSVEYITSSKLVKRKKISNKGSFANVFIIGGSSEYPGAGCISHMASTSVLNDGIYNNSQDGCLPSQLSATAAFKGGAGLSRLVVADCDRSLFSNIKETMIATLPSRDGKLIYDKESIDALISDNACVVIGCGSGRNAELNKIVSHLFRKKIKLIIDADAINIFDRFNDLREAVAEVLFTPHIKEFARLTLSERAIHEKVEENALNNKTEINALYEKSQVDAILKNPVNVVQEFAKSYKCKVLLKSNYNIATDGIKTYIANNGSPTLAKGGSGDMLAGIIAGMSGSFDLLFASINACVLIGETVQSLVKIKGENSIVASDIISAIKY